MATAEYFVSNHRYICHNCDVSFNYPQPKEGHWFETSGGYRDDDGDVFIEGDVKVLIGNKTLACHNDDYPCMINDGDWTSVECQGYRCGSCGAEYMWDNEKCSDHTWDYDGQKPAEKAALNCCRDKKNTPDSDLAALGTPRAGAQKVTVIEF